MRSLVAVAALALAASLDTVAAVEQCTPGGTRPPLTSWLSRTKTTSAQTQTSLSGSIETALSSTTGPAISPSVTISNSLSGSSIATSGIDGESTPGVSKTDSASVGSQTGSHGSQTNAPGSQTDSSATTPYVDPTQSSPTSTATSGPRVIKNEVSNGNFAKANPDGSIPSWSIEGDVKVNVGPGYTGDGSRDKGCAALTASDESSGGGLEKRVAGPFAGITQNIFNLDTRTLYTIRFFFLVITAPNNGFNICQLNAYLGSQNFYSQWIFSVGASVQWNTVLTQVPVSAAFAPLGISVNCFSGGLALVYVDSIFMSNMVTPANINDFNLDFGGDDDTVSTTSSIATTTRPGTASVSTLSVTGSVSGSASSVTGSVSGSVSSVTGASATGSAASSPSTSVTGSSPSGSSAAGTGSASTTGSISGIPSGATTGTQSSVTGTASVNPSGASTQTQSGGSQGPSGSSTQGQNPSQSNTQTQGSQQSGATTTSARTATSASSSTLPSVQPVSRICANVGSSPIDGRLCGVHPYNSANVYRILPAGPIQREECAAVCLSDPRCKHFEWKYGTDNCGNECRLSDSELRADNVGTLGSNFDAYDRSCAWTIPCPAYPADGLCLNRIGDTPLAGCSKRMGTLKSCTTPMLQFSISPCGGTDSCRHMCNTYPGCKSFSYTTLTTTNNCKLYTGTTEEIADTGGNTYFQDLSCFACGENMGWSTYGLVTNDQYELPPNTCSAPTTSRSGSSASSTASTSSVQTGSVDPSRTVTSQPSTTEPYNDGTTGTVQCQRYFAPPGYCSGLGGPQPTQTGFIEGTSGTGATPQKICGALGVKQGTYETVERSRYPQQDENWQCALLCYRRTGCKSFALSQPDAVTGKRHCLLSNNRVLYDGIDIRAEGSVYWSDEDCYDCVKCDIPWGASASTSSATTSGAATTSSAGNPGSATNSGSAVNPGSATNSGAATNSPSATTSGTPTESSNGGSGSSSTPGTGTGSPTTTTPAATTSAASNQGCPLALEQGCTWNQNYAVNASMPCQRNGRFQPPDIYYLEGGIYPQEQMHEELCTALCAEFSDRCKGSAWDTERGRCVFAYKSISDLTAFEPAPFDPATGSYHWVDQRCIACPCDSSTPVVTPTSTTTTTTTTTTSEDQSELTPAPVGEDAPLTSIYCERPTRPVNRDGKVCGKTGQQTKYQFSDSDYIPVTDEYECASLCLQSVYCRSFEHNTETQTCVLMPDNPSNIGLVLDPTFMTDYYDRNCFVCPQAL